MLHPNRMGRQFAAVALALGMLATACGESPTVDEASVRPEVDHEALLDQAIANLVRINGPYETSTAEASVPEASLVPHWLPGINGPYQEEFDAEGPPDWLIDINGPYTDEAAEEVPANAR